ETAALAIARLAPGLRDADERARLVRELTPLRKDEEVRVRAASAFSLICLGEDDAALRLELFDLLATNLKEFCPPLPSCVVEGLNRRYEPEGAGSLEREHVLKAPIESMADLEKFVLEAGLTLKAPDSVHLA